MPNMNSNYRNAVADHGGTLITHIGLVDNTGTELSGGDPAYARQPTTWDAADDGTIRPSDSLVFNAPAGANVSGWRGYSALTGGTEYGGKALTREDYVGQGTYLLDKEQTAIKHE